MKDPELELLISELETRADMTVADFDGVLHALEYLLAGAIPKDTSAGLISSTDGAIRVADDAYPN